MRISEVVSLLVLFLIGLGLEYTGLWDTSVLEPNQCLMTWMRRNPNYYRVDLGEEVARFCGDNTACESHASTYYSLHLYSEEPLRETGGLGGIPVLFVPGNEGSKNQVRSIASIWEQLKVFGEELGSTAQFAQLKSEFQRIEKLSVAANTTEKKEKGNHSRPIVYDFFTISFEEEDSGIVGGFLDIQSRFLAACIHRLHLNSKGQKVFLVGHSMGGIVSRGVFTVPGFDERLVKNIITLATPHASPVVTLDAQMARFYHAMNTFWIEKVFHGPSDVLLIAIGGGVRDTLVRSDLTYHMTTTLDHSYGRYGQLVSQKRAGPNVVANVASNIPHVWASVDHQCIMWCRQLIYVLARMLNDLVDPTTGQVRESLSDRHKIVSHYLVAPSFSPTGKVENGRNTDVNSKSTDLAFGKFVSGEETEKPFRVALNTDVVISTNVHLTSLLRCSSEDICVTADLNSDDWPSHSVHFKEDGYIPEHNPYRKKEYSAMHNYDYASPFVRRFHVSAQPGEHLLFQHIRKSENDQFTFNHRKPFIYLERDDMKASVVKINCFGNILALGECIFGKRVALSKNSRLQIAGLPSIFVAFEYSLTGSCNRESYSYYPVLKKFTAEEFSETTYSVVGDLLKNNNGRLFKYTAEVLHPQTLGGTLMKTVFGKLWKVDSQNANTNTLLEGRLQFFAGKSAEMVVLVGHSELGECRSTMNIHLSIDATLAQLFRFVGFKIDMVVCYMISLCLCVWSMQDKNVSFFNALLLCGTAVLDIGFLSVLLAICYSMGETYATLHSGELYTKATVGVLTFCVVSGTLKLLRPRQKQIFLPQFLFVLSLLSSYLEQNSNSKSVALVACLYIHVISLARLLVIALVPVTLSAVSHLFAYLPFVVHLLVVALLSTSVHICLGMLYLYIFLKPTMQSGCQHLLFLIISIKCVPLLAYIKNVIRFIELNPSAIHSPLLVLQKSSLTFLGIDFFGIVSLCLLVLTGILLQYKRTLAPLRSDIPVRIFAICSITVLQLFPLEDKMLVISDQYTVIFLAFSAFKVMARK
eukprot:Nk52_evm36s293 gene=Nk52_evmTU36s293